jgi:hypothetical protein
MDSTRLIEENKTNTPADSSQPRWKFVGKEDHMTRTLITACLIGVLSCGLAWAQTAGKRAFRFNGEIVELGDSKYEVMSKIGEPDGVLRTERELFQELNPRRVQTNYIQHERWLYNFGPRRFYHILSFQDKRLVDIEEGEYGYDASDPENCHVVKSRVRVGDIIPVVIMKCGEPNYTETSYRERYVKYDDYRSERITIKIEEWTYNFGPGQPLSLLCFENGVLVSFERGQRGF